ncbi:hypothetical protein CCACVL1_05028 [Corchorus capsularis]|uniref:Uncharacterized protein n=1 Tax=Corchorus capsularis TaxID=210143 RepID=A0A1R3JN59_COCAP|nr:hypothetical protein CCACVL1_05028 [Corchorus capsularis]
MVKKVSCGQPKAGEGKLLPDVAAHDWVTPIRPFGAVSASWVSSGKSLKNASEKA